MTRAACTRLLNLLGMIVVTGVLFDGLSDGRGAPSIYVFMLINFGLTYRVLGPRPKWMRLAMFTNSGVGLIGTALAVAMYANHDRIGVPVDEMRTYLALAAFALGAVVLNVWILFEKGVARLAQTPGPGDIGPAPDSSDSDEPGRRG